MALLFSNTVAEAVDWLAEKTGEPWSVRRLLKFILTRKLSLDVVPPRDAQFGVYLHGHFPPQQGYLPVGPFSRIGIAAEIPRFRLRERYVIDLLEHGEAELIYAHVPADDEPTGRWVIHEPMSGPPMRVTLDMCRVSMSTLRAIAASHGCILARLPEDEQQADPCAAEPTDASPASGNSDTPPAAVGAISGSGAALLTTNGPNSKADMDAYIGLRAREIYREGEATTGEAIAKLIESELTQKKFKGPGGAHLSAATVKKAIPTGLTGGRKKNGKAKRF